LRKRTANGGGCGEEAAVKPGSGYPKMLSIISDHILNRKIILLYSYIYMYL